MVIDVHTLPCYFANGFCRPTTKTLFTLVWFSDDFCFIFTLQVFVGRMTKINDRYWTETDSFIHFSLPDKSDASYGIECTSFPFIHAPHTQNPHNPSFSRLELFPHTQTLCGKPELLCTTHNSDRYVTYQEGFNMHTGQPNPQPIINEYVSSKTVLDTTTKYFVFPSLNVSNNFATIDYDAHINTKLDYTINQVFCSMTIQKPNTLHTICKLERNQLLTIFCYFCTNSSTCQFPFQWKPKKFPLCRRFHGLII